NDIEVEFLIAILTKINQLCSDEKFEDYLIELRKQKGKKPRFKAIYLQKTVSFPEFISSEIPKLSDHKLSRKVEAKIALENNIKPGRYKKQQAQVILNKLRECLVAEIDNEVKKSSYKENVKNLITRS